MADERPDFAAASMSSALADLMASAFFSSAAAIAKQTRIFPRRRELGEFARRHPGLPGQLRHMLIQGHVERR